MGTDLNNFGSAKKRVSLMFSGVEDLLQVASWDRRFRFGNCFAGQKGFVY